MADFNIKETEEKIREFWEKNKTYKFNINSKSKIYSIDTPPPTVSGAMHIGHAFSYAQQDFIARYKRMQGFNVFYPFGTDDNGLPTEKLIEKTKNIKSKDMSRNEFIKICLDTLKEISPNFIQDWKNLGVSCDYSIFYSTIDKNTQKLSQKYFLDLYKKNLVYKKEFPTIWDIEFQTPVSQAELEDKEQETLFSTLKFKVKENNQDLLIATTRPELLAACVAVFINPKDKRYNKLIGEKALVPIFNHEVPILGDESAQMDKGTGILMVCSYGDKYDVEAVQKHKLKPRIIFTKSGHLNLPNTNYNGLRIKQARTKILEDLKNKNLITEQKKISNVVNVYEKSGVEIEFIPTEQWFIKILDKKSELIKYGKKIKWHPEYMYKRYEHWINGLEWDWNISRERHFGIPIPVWHCKTCDNIILAEEKELPVDPTFTKKICPKCKKECVGEDKVLDTWATSSLTPQIAQSLTNNKIKIPYSLRPQAHDIIRTWAFYTIVRSLLHEKNIPWNEIAISGNVSLGGEKMSKSKGNVIDPKLIMQNYGVDALRYWASASKLGEDLDYQEKDVVTGKKFVTKILNATNFVFMNLKYQGNSKPPRLEETDRLFLVELNKTINETTQAFSNYNYSKSKQEADNFFWKTMADNYLEIVKNRVYNGNEEEKASAYYTLYHSLLTILKLMAPITPYITEYLYQEHFKKYEKISSIHISAWPEKFKIKESKEDNKTWSRLIEIISLVRQAKSEAKKSMKAEIILTLTKEDNKIIKPVLKDLKAVTNTIELKEGKFRIEVL
ncbi:MAG TPA: valine--tRNA ligase [Candidatus Nanoarchaeia archaeon]|nr:valine--tRNA ligase [Candidatus Nanoarchaeia archaeon]